MGRRKKVHKSGAFCPVCGMEADMTDRGEIRKEWAEPYGHRDLRGDPCVGVRPQKVEA